MLSQLMRRKALADATSEAEAPEQRLKRTLGAIDLTALGIGAVIGAGIFSSTGTAVAGGGGHIGAGPALILSYVLTAVACGFAALCYAEMASMIPIAGSAYTYAYVTLGELLAWIIGWDLILEYAVGNVAVAVSWSGYFKSFVEGFGVHLPGVAGLDGQPGARQPGDRSRTRRTCFGIPIVFNLPAGGDRRPPDGAARRRRQGVGARQLGHRGHQDRAGRSPSSPSARFWVAPANWHPFAPNGFKGILTGASVIFFAYIGFDAISTTAEECKNPQRDLPHRHDRVAHHLHRALRRRHRRAHRHGAGRASSASPIRWRWRCRRRA